jgi:epoxyqueuosine reductase QueG
VEDILRNSIPDVVSGVFWLTSEILAKAPETPRECLSGYVGWAVLVFAIPIRDEVLWVWHKQDGNRTLFANGILAQTADRVQAFLTAENVASVDVPRTFARRISLTVLGELAGLGTRGINNLLLHPRHGSWLQLHALLVEEELPQDAPLHESVCISCLRCVAACPADALAVEMGFFAARCARLVASPWDSKSKAIALTANSYIECAECIASCPIGEQPERIFQWRR